MKLSRRPVAVSFVDAVPGDVNAFEGTEPAGCSFWRLAAQLTTQFVRELLDSLADDFELAQRGVLSHVLGEERVAPRAGVRGDVSESVADMLQIDVVVAHSAWASVRIRSCR